MSRLCKPLNESTLNTSLNEIAHALLRELSMACKKVSIYGPDHPSADRAVEKPFFVFNEIFGFRKYANINLQNGQLFVLNIRVRDSVFSAEITRYMQTLNVTAILFERGMAMADLGGFMNRFVRRVNVADHRNLLSTYLKDSRIDTIEVNTERAIRFFESGRQYRGDVDGDFSLKAMVSQALGEDLIVLAELSSGEDEFAARHEIDFDEDILSYVIPEKVSSLSQGAIRSELDRFFRRLAACEDPQERADLVRLFAAIDRLLYYHSKRDEIIKDMEDNFANEGLSPEVADELRTPAGRIKQESNERINNLLASTFAPGISQVDAASFTDAFNRLRKTGQTDRAGEVYTHLLDLLGAVNAEFRHKALTLLLDIVKNYDLSDATGVTRRAIDRVVAKLAEKKETFEYSEFIWQVLQKCLKARRYDLAATLTRAMALRRRIAKDVTVYDSITVKKVFDNFDQSEFVDQLVGDLANSDFDTSLLIREILCSAGSEAVALALAGVISHPKRQLRQQALKVLGDLGKASLEVGSQILADESMFARGAGETDLPDENWYVIRNSIFVLGLLEDAGAVSALKRRISDPDFRVRREIVRTLEKIGGEEACDLLMMMANDHSSEIRDLAIITMGIIGPPDIAPLVAGLARANPKVALKAISALGKLGGEQAEEFLSRALTDEEELQNLTSSRHSKEDLRLAIVKALGQIGDMKSIKSIKDFKANQSAAQRIFFKNSPVNKAISQVLSRH